MVSWERDCGFDRYDGYRSKDQTSLRLPDGLSSRCTFARCWLIIRAGFGWAATAFSIAMNPLPKHLLISRSIRIHPEPLSLMLGIDEDHAGDLWISTTRGLYRFNPLTLKRTRYVHDSKDQYSISTNLIYKAPRRSAGPVLDCKQRRIR